MSVAVWPDTLPCPMREGYEASRQDPRQRRAASGPPGYRRRFSSAARLVRLTLEVSRAQKAVFDNFQRNDTRDGTLPFYMPDPTTDGWPMLTGDGTPVLTGAGAPVLLSARWLCLFGEDVPVETIIGVRFRIAFSVAVMP